MTPNSERVDLLAATALGLAFVDRFSDVSLLIDLTDDSGDLTAARSRVLTMQVGDEDTRHAAAELLAHAAQRGGPAA